MATQPWLVPQDIVNDEGIYYIKVKLTLTFEAWRREREKERRETGGGIERGTTFKVEGQKILRAGKALGSEKDECIECGLRYEYEQSRGFTAYDWN
jgi:hypothetical protein